MAEVSALTKRNVHRVMDKSPRQRIQSIEGKQPKHDDVTCWMSGKKGHYAGNQR